MAEQHRDKNQQDYLIDQTQAIRDEIEVSVFGPLGADTFLCYAEALPTAKLIAKLLCRIEALEVRNGDALEAWAAMRRAGSSATERIGALEKRIESLEASQPPQPNHPEIPDGSLEQRVSEHIEGKIVLTAGLVERMATEALKDSVNVTTQPNHPAKPDSSLVDRVEDALDMARDDSEAKARAAIREVAAWLRTKCGGHLGSGLHYWAIRLEQEAMR